ncbi:MAG: DUF3365 domain-containing protein [Symploca sp. SIO1B1]|nr:DUF3365 domain-containing protein [Symploca sp. SIO1B1]
MSYLLRQIKAKTLALISLAAIICVTAIACGGGGSSSEQAVGIPPEIVADYVHTTLAADRTAYTKHVVNRAKTLEGKEKEKGVLEIEATEGWENTDGIPLPAQMFRLGSEIATDYAADAGLSFSYNLISTWNLNDSQAPKNEFEEEAMEAVNKTGEPFKGYQEVGDQTYFSALYPDIAVAEACVTCHNTHPLHLERYPDKVFEMGDVMGGVMINLPIEKT